MTAAPAMQTGTAQMEPGDEPEQRPQQQHRNGDAVRIVVAKLHQEGQRAVSSVPDLPYRLVLSPVSSSGASPDRSSAHAHASGIPHLAAPDFRAHRTSQVYGLPDHPEPEESRLPRSARRPAILLFLPLHGGPGWLAARSARSLRCLPNSRRFAHGLWRLSWGPGAGGVPRRRPDHGRRRRGSDHRNRYRNTEPMIPSAARCRVSSKGDSARPLLAHKYI